MKARTFGRMNVLAFLILLLGPVTVHRAEVRGEDLAPVKEVSNTRMESLFAHLPIDFIPNRGQTDERVDFYIKGSDKTIFFTPEGLTFVLTAPAPPEENAPKNLQHGGNASPRKPSGRTQRWAVRLDFVGTNPNVHAIGELPSETVISYFRGSPERWLRGIHPYRRIVYYDLWTGIDLAFYGTVEGLKYEFIVHPGADPRQIRLRYRGAEVTRAAGGGLEVSTPLGGFSDAPPTAYQEKDGRRLPVIVSYAIQARTSARNATAEDETLYAFSLGAYDPTRPLVLDPAILVYCGYLGGGEQDEGNAIAVDWAGSAYLAGWTESSDSENFPMKVGPDLTYGDWGDAFVAKVMPDGSGLVYAGYIGGSDEDWGYGVAVDEAGSAYVVGTTLSSESEDFPVLGGPDLTHNGETDVFIAKVKPDGTGLLYAGYIGGAWFEDGYGVAADAAGNAYVVGRTLSTEGADFPVTVGPDLTHNGEGSYDAFVAKVKPDGSLSYCGYIGGEFDDYGRGIAVDGAGNAYIVGDTWSSESDGFPVLVGPDTTFNGDYTDAYVAKVRADGTGLVYAGYIGGSSDEDGYGIAVDGAGNAYIVGCTYSTESEGFPVLKGPDLTYNDGFDAFIAKVRADGTGLDYAGYIGGAGYDEALGVAVDGLGNAYVIGSTDSSESEGFPASGGPDSTYNGGEYDIFVAKVHPTGVGFSYCGYLGGKDDEKGRGIAVDGAGNAYVTGYTYSSEEEGFPVVVGPDLTYNRGTGYQANVFVAKVTQPTYRTYLPLVTRLR